NYFVPHINNDLSVPANQFEHWTAFDDPDQLCSDGTNRPLNAFQQQITTLSASTGCPVECAQDDVRINKSSNPVAGTSVLPGETIEYTITVDNVGLAPQPNFSLTDDLSDVLDDAAL